MVVSSERECAMTRHSNKEFIDQLVSSIFRAERKNLRIRELTFIYENRKLSSNHSDGFYFSGKYYSDLVNSLVSKGTKGFLHISLVPQMQAYVKDKSMMEFEETRVRQCLVLVLQPCASSQDYRDALPNLLVEKVSSLRELPRTRPEGYTLENNPMQMKQYQKLREKIEYYNTLGLFY